MTTADRETPPFPDAGTDTGTDIGTDASNDARNDADGPAAHYLAACLPEQWRRQPVQRPRFALVATGFGRGDLFVATWLAFVGGAEACPSLSYFAVDEELPRVEALCAAQRTASPAAQPLWQELIANWPAMVPGLHRLSLCQGRVELLLTMGKTATWARERVGLADAFVLDGRTAAAQAALDNPAVLKALARRAAPDATVTCLMPAAQEATAVAAWRANLSTAGFDLEEPLALGTDLGCLRGRRRNSLLPAVPDHRRTALAPLRGASVLVVGGGLAGCAVARALVLRGARVTIADIHAEPAQATSGNAAALFHGVLHVPDSVHARLHRAAALAAARDIATLARSQPLAHGFGMLRLELGMDEAAMRRHLHTSGLAGAEAAGSSAPGLVVAEHTSAGLAEQPYVQVLGEAAAQALCGLPAAHPAWHYPAGGWVDPAALCRAWLADATRHTRQDPVASLLWRGSTPVDALSRNSQGWQGHGLPGISFDAVVVAASGGASKRLLSPHSDAAEWGLLPARGQVLVLPAAVASRCRPHLAVAGAGYTVPLPDGRVLLGSTTQVGDEDDTVREGDTLALWERAVEMGLVTGPMPCGLSTRTGPSEPSRAGVRWATADRLPVIGPVVDTLAGAQAQRQDQPRFVPRVPGLWVFTGLGSRGVGWAAWGAELIATAMEGAPPPLESSLLDRVDAGRFASRRARRPGGEMAADPATAP